LFVEILLVGFASAIWAGLILIGFTNHDLLSGKQLLSLSFGSLFPLLAAFYTIGWPVNFLFERVFHKFFRRNIRGKYFENTDEYEKAKVFLMLNGSNPINDSIHFNRHIIRMSRSTACSGILISIRCLLNSLWIPALLSFFLSILSYFQHLGRLDLFTKKIRIAYDILKNAS